MDLNVQKAFSLTENDFTIENSVAHPEAVVAFSAFIVFKPLHPLDVRGDANI